ncbi:exodeoxyribonuclease VII small subunit [Algoriphagus halophytocola]|uniref:Exodeoxyribonuclease VII small subunit n=1 Tax=Algoriphagus halophytocola TaxID=2991499 RepID=A0ABY6MK86_9BACT|nr:MULTISPECIES: exodeoxyribonuclease VII small subunit [unclassified Algoriphagus]UZD22614.1 exodeoxyribonuclease VII small subunit [Algoriphagus sp. TR-M5]WBL43880.1 exodeoxyribonuclease VII small subunit [Algoriphagus sp. TR-M9]
MSNLKYNEAMSRLEVILTELEEGKKSVDELSEMVKEAAELVKLCKSKLKSTEEDIQKAFDEA